MAGTGTKISIFAAYKTYICLPVPDEFRTGQLHNKSQKFYFLHQFAHLFPIQWVSEYFKPLAKQSERDSGCPPPSSDEVKGMRGAVTPLLIRLHVTVL
jgi:hypothetical protein